MTEYVNIPEFYNRPKEAGEVWRLRKGRRTAGCNLWTHPIGGEVRVTVDGEPVRSESGPRRDEAYRSRAGMETAISRQGVERMSTLIRHPSTNASRALLAVRDWQ